MTYRMRTRCVREWKRNRSRSLQPAHRVKHSAIRTRWRSELGGETLLFHDGAQVLLDDEHPYLLYDCRRSIYFDYLGLGVPGIVLQIRSSPELTQSGFAGVHKFRIVAQYRSPSNLTAVFCFKMHNSGRIGK